MEMNFDDVIHVVSLEADFEKMTWTFQIDEKTPVGSGVYALVYVGPAPVEKTEV